MGQQIIRQPDGKLAVFSSIVDSWILYDANEEGLEEYFAEQAAAESRRMTRQAIADLDAGVQRRPFMMSFEEADEIASRHGGRLAEVRE